MDHYELGTKQWVRFSINCLKYSECLKFYYLFVPILLISATQCKDNKVVPSSIKFPVLLCHREEGVYARETTLQCRNHWPCGSWENYPYSSYYKGYVTIVFSYVPPRYSIYAVSPQRSATIT